MGAVLKPFIFGAIFAVALGWSYAHVILPAQLAKMNAISAPKSVPAALETTPVPQPRRPQL